MKVLTNLKRISLRLPRLVKRQVYTSLARFIWEYGSEIFDNCSEEECKLLENIQGQFYLINTGALKKPSHHLYLQNADLSHFRIPVLIVSTKYR